MALIPEKISKRIVEALGYMGRELPAAPAAPPANGYVIYAVDNGGKTQLLVKFATGAAQQIAIQP